MKTYFFHNIAQMHNVLLSWELKLWDVICLISIENQNRLFS